VAWVKTLRDQTSANLSNPGPTYLQKKNGGDVMWILTKTGMVGTTPYLSRHGQCNYY